MTANSLNLQDHFLNSIRRSKLPTTLYLLKGVKLQGTIGAFDPYAILLRRNGSSQLVYKHALSTIMPAAAPPDFLAEYPRIDARAGLQDQFLSSVIRDGGPLTIFLVNGVMLTGQLTGFDPFSLILERGDQMQLVYKHAVSTLQPDHAVSLTSLADGAEAQE